MGPLNIEKIDSGINKNQLQEQTLFSKEEEEFYEDKFKYKVGDKFEKILCTKTLTEVISSLCQEKDNKLTLSYELMCWKPREKIATGHNILVQRKVSDSMSSIRNDNGTLAIQIKKLVTGFVDGVESPLSME